MNEVQTLRKALQEITCADWECEPSATDADISRLKSQLIMKMQRIAADALSQQVEPAPAQDEREAFEAWMVEVEGARIRPRFDRVTAGPFADEYRDGRIQGAWNVWQARAARPAQTEQQPVATWMGTDWNAQQQLIAHLCKLEPGTDLYAAPIAQTEQQPIYQIRVQEPGACWSDVQEGGYRIAQTDGGLETRVVYAAPIAQTAPQPVSSALSAVTAERDRLAAALSAPDTITAEPAGDYDNLRKQFHSLRMLANSNAKMVHYWRAKCDRDTRETLLANAASVNAERDTNALLTDSLEAAEAERDQLRAEVDGLRNEHAARESMARRLLWLAFVWNDHNFLDAHIEARREAEAHGITTLEQANEWLSRIDATLAAKEA